MFCVDARLYSQSGIGTFLKNLLPDLSAKFPLTLLCYESDCDALSPLSSHLVVMKSAIYTIQEQLELPYKIPSCRFFLSPHFNVPLLPIRAKKRLTVIQDLYHFAFFNTLSLKQKLYAKLVYNAAIKLSHQVITLSHFSKNEILKYLKIPKKEIVTLPIYFSYKPYETKSHGDFLLAVGNLKKHKNLQRLLTAYSRLKPQEKLVIVGKSQKISTIQPELVAQIKNDPFLKKNVELTGELSDKALKRLYAQAKLFIYPSYYEGFGYPPLEAMSSSCPTLAAKHSSIPEVCQAAVHYFNPYSITDLQESLDFLLKNEKRRQELIEKGQALIKYYSDQKSRVKRMEVIDACCDSA